MCSLPRLWSSWIPNFSPWLTWLKPTGSNGRSWIGRDNTTTARLRRRAPAVLLKAQKQAAAAWPKQATLPAAATTNHPRTLVSFWRSSVRLFLASPPPPLRWGLPWRQCMQRFPGCSAATPGFLRLEHWRHQTSFPARFSPRRAAGWRNCWACSSNTYRSADAVRWQTQSTVSTCQPLS